MRIIAGDFKGHLLFAPKGKSVRPTSDRVREAVFSALGDVSGCIVLDLYCGTGALGLEALSRGARHCTLIDRDPSLARGNVERLGVADRTTLVGCELPNALSSHGGILDPGASFDLIFCDPPYNLAPRFAEQLDHQIPSHLSPQGRVVVESSARDPLRLPSLSVLRQRRYGSTDITFYMRSQDTK